MADTTDVSEKCIHTSSAVFNSAVSVLRRAVRPSESSTPELGRSPLRQRQTTLLIDPVVTDIWQGDSPYPLLELEVSEGRTYALITHTHGDHFDTPGLKRLLGERGRVICDAEMAPYIASQGLKVIPVNRFQPENRGGFTVVPLPAADGLGDRQVSWVISAGGQRFIHCGDTVWHGAWRKWGAVYGPFDTAFLPINGAIQAEEPPSEVPLSLTPEQAVDATILLGAKRLVPIPPEEVSAQRLQDEVQKLRGDDR